MTSAVPLDRSHFDRLFRRFSLQTLWPFLAFGLLAVHLIAVQIAAASPIVCCLLPKGEEHPFSRSAAKRLARHGIVALLVGVAVGLLLGWLAMSNSPRDYGPILARFYNRVWWGGWELVFSLVVMLAYWLPWNFWRATKGRRIAHGLLAVVGATNLLYHFPPLLTVMAAELTSASSLVPPDGGAVERISSPEFRGLIAQPLVIAKSLHFVFAALAVTSAWLMLFHPSANKVSDHPARRGAMIALGAMAVQMLIGMWLVVQVPAQEQSALMGGDPIAAVLLLASIVFSLGAMNQLGAIAIDGQLESTSKQVRSAAIGVLVIATVMICVAGRLSGLGG